MLPQLQRRSGCHARLLQKTGLCPEPFEGRVSRGDLHYRACTMDTGTQEADEAFVR